MEVPKKIAAVQIVQIVLAFIGAADAGILWWAHRSSISLPCTSGGGCEVVAESKWAHITLGPFQDIPIALLGLMMYVAVLVLSTLKYAEEKPAIVRKINLVIIPALALGVCYSWFLQYVSHFKLGAFCAYCFTSACDITILFALFCAERALLNKIDIKSAKTQIDESSYASTK